MKSVRYVLLVIGLLGTAAAVYSLIQGDPFTYNIITIVCSAALVFGYYELGQKAKKPS